MTDWKETDQAVGRMAEIEVEIKMAEAEMNSDINKAKKQAEGIILPLMEEYEKLELEVEAYSGAHKDEFVKKRTKKLFYGKVNFRVSTKIEIIVADEVCVRSLRKLGLEEYVDIKETPAKESMEALSDDVLAKVGAKRVLEDNCTVTPDMAKVKIKKEEVSA